MLVRSAMHKAGASALTELLRFAAPDQRVIPCPCGQPARDRELRSKTIVTVLGEAIVSRPCYLCPHLHRRAVPHRFTTGHRGYGVLPRRPPHARARRPASSLRSRQRITAAELFSKISIRSMGENITKQPGINPPPRRTPTRADLVRVAGRRIMRDYSISDFIFGNAFRYSL
jgi:hypothetical protein